MKLTEREKQKVVELIQEGKPITVIYKSKHFDSEDTEFIENDRIFSYIIFIYFILVYELKKID